MEKETEIQNFVKKVKSLSLSRFLNYCLYKKNHGYYQKNKIGNDFITAPEISQMFGECVSIFLVNFLKKFHINNICELGPGNGTLSKDIIRVLGKIIDTNLDFYLYEKSQYLRSIQYNLLKNKGNSKIRINHMKDFKLKEKPIIFICNEFFDALPINQFIKKKKKWYERRVVYKNKKFQISEKTNYKNKNVNDLRSKDGDILEISPLTNLYLKKIFKHIKYFGGGVLIFDYGPMEKKNKDTIQAINQKKKCSYLDFPFNSDITYHVNFREIMRLAGNFELNIYGPISQKKFLFYNGINERFMTLKKEKSLKIINKLEDEFYRLVDPKGMGELIKCLFISSQGFNFPGFYKYD